MPSAYLDLTKPRLVLMAILAALSSLFMASKGYPSPMLLFHTLLGCALIGGGANALNQFFERELDAKMIRTQNRPLPSGRLHKKQALIFGGTLAIGGTFYLSVFANKLTGAIGFLLLVIYVFVYTPLKQKTPLNTLVGAIPGAMPALLGWAAVRGRLDRDAFALFAMLFVWQLPHFLAIAWVHREDYVRGGFRMIGIYDTDHRNAGRQIVIYCLLLFVLSLFPTVLGLTGLTYLFMAVFLGVNLCGFAIYLASHKLSHAKAFVYGSIIYLFAINISMVMDKI